MTLTNLLMRMDLATKVKIVRFEDDYKPITAGEAGRLTIGETRGLAVVKFFPEEFGITIVVK